MKRLEVLRRSGHELEVDGDACLAYLHRAGIPAHLGKSEPGRNILWVEDADVERTGALLRAHRFEVTSRG